MSVDTGASWNEGDEEACRMIRTLLVEDDIDLATTLVQYLELENIHCDHASNGVAGLNLVEQNDYQVLLLDLNLPRLDGLSVCQRLREQGNDTPILMLTARDSLSDKLEGFRVGTDDYLVKPFDMEELVVRVTALARRRSGQVQKLSFAGLEMQLDSRSISRDGESLKLSPTGWKILECLLRAAPAAVSREALMDQVWGDDQPDSNSLKVHMHNLRKAVDSPFQQAMIQTLPGQGFSLRAPDDSAEAADSGSDE